MSIELAERFGRNLWRSRRRADLSQEELAELAEVGRGDVSLIERGGRLPRIDTILKLAAGVETSPCALLAGLHWQPGHYVEGRFWVDDGSERLRSARGRG